MRLSPAQSRLASEVGRRTNLRASFDSALFASLITLASSTFADAVAADIEKDYRLKAAFILHFASLVEWPAGAFGDSEDPIVICHVGGGRTRALLESAYSGRMVESRSIETRHLASSNGVSGCHILLITAERRGEARGFIDAVVGQSILTIGETEGFARDGGMIGFYDEGSKVRFEINPEAVESANLRISSRLLKLARLVSSAAP